MKTSSFVKWTVLTLGSMLFAAILISLKPVPNAPEEKCAVSKGILSAIEEGSSYDIYLSLEGDDKRYYINRGMERGLAINELKEQLVGQAVTVTYPKYWTVLDPFGKTRHIAKLEYQNQVLFSEIPNNPITQ